MSTIAQQTKDALRDMIRTIVREEVAVAMKEHLLDLVTDPEVDGPDPDKLQPLPVNPAWKGVLTETVIDDIVRQFTHGADYREISKATGLSTNKINVALSHRLTPNERKVLVSKKRSERQRGSARGN